MGTTSLSATVLDDRHVARLGLGMGQPRLFDHKGEHGSVDDL